MIELEPPVISVLASTIDRTEITPGGSIALLSASASWTRTLIRSASRQAWQLLQLDLAVPYVPPPHPHGSPIRVCVDTGRSARDVRARFFIC